MLHFKNHFTIIKHIFSIQRAFIYIMYIILFDPYSIFRSWVREIILILHMKKLK